MKYTLPIEIANERNMSLRYRRPRIYTEYRNGGLQFTLFDYTEDKELRAQAWVSIDKYIKDTSNLARDVQFVLQDLIDTMLKGKIREMHNAGKDN